MTRVTGVGAIFLKARDPGALRAWYRAHLGIDAQEGGGWTFRWSESAPDREGVTVWSVFPADSHYFDPSPAPFMVNYRVVDLAEVLAALRAEGCTVDDHTEESEYGKFGWVMDPEGTGWSCGSPRRDGFPDEVLKCSTGFANASPTPKSGASCFSIASSLASRARG